MAYSVLRTLVNRAGIVYDELKTHVVFAEDMNAIKGDIEYLESNRSAISIILNAANLGSGYLTRWDGSKLVNSKIYDNGTNVGIGTTSPIAPLTVVKAPSATTIGGRYISIGREEDLSSAIRGIGFGFIQGDAVESPAFIGYQQMSGAGNTKGDLFFGTRGTTGPTDAPTERMRITSDGNVGIGTTNPGKTLTIQKDGITAQAFAIQNDSTGANRYSELLFSHSTGAGSAGIRGYAVNLGTGNASQLRFFNTDQGTQAVTERMTINENGNVGIGTTSPTAKLDILSDILRLRTAKTPATAGAAGNQGDMCWDSGYLYICVSTNAWVRSALATW